MSISNKKLLLIGCILCILAIFAFRTFAKTSPSPTTAPTAPVIAPMDHVKLMLNHLTKTKENFDTTVNPNGVNPNGMPIYIAANNAITSDSTIAVVSKPKPNDTVDQTTGKTFSDLSNNLINGIPPLVKMYKDVTGADPKLKYDDLQPVTTMADFYFGSATNMSFLSKFMNIIGPMGVDMITVLLTPQNGKYRPDLYRELAAVFIALIFAYANGIVSFKQNQDAFGVVESVVIINNIKKEATLSTFAPNPNNPPQITPPIMENMMNAVKNYFKSITPPGSTDSITANNMLNELLTKTSSTILIEDLGKLLLLRLYFGSGMLPK